MHRDIHAYLTVIVLKRL